MIAKIVASNILIFVLFLFYSFTDLSSLNYDAQEQQICQQTYSYHLGDTTSLYAMIYEAEEVVVALSSKIRQIASNFKDGNATEGKVSVSVDGQSYSFTTMFELGGKTRRKICKMPPVKLNVKKKELQAQGFSKGLDKSKIVFQCNTSKNMAQSIKMEKLLYDLYSVVSPYGRRSKMIKVKIDGEKKIFDAFLLEDDDDFEVRTGTQVLKNKTIATTSLNREEYVKMCMFQFMISNADWSARKGHNTDLYRRIEDNSLIVVPYDFDYSGIINNSYAVAPENLPISKVTERYFMDKSISMTEMKECINYFLLKEAAMFERIEDASFLADNSKKRITKFVGDFYKIIRNEKKVKRLIKK